MAKRKRKYMWLVIMDGTSHGEYENGATVLVCRSFKQAKQAMEDDIAECLANIQLMDGDHPSIEELMADKVERFGVCEAQLRDLGSIRDWKIERHVVYLEDKEDKE